MANDLGQHLRKALVAVLSDPVPDKAKKSGLLSGGKGVAAGAGLGVLAPLAGKGVMKLAKGKLPDVPNPKKAAGKLGETVKSAVPDVGDGGQSNTPPGTGEGRRMPIQQSMDVGVPVRVAYNQWTQFEDWTRFMHRLESVSQKDDCTVSISSKIWGINKTFEAEIVEQYPDERIMWEVVSGPSHTGVVTFHPLAERLTRIELTLDVDPDSLLEKAGRGWRFLKRAVRADMHRFKAFVEMNGEETGGWRGVIEDGEVVESHEDQERQEDSQEQEAEQSQQQSQGQEQEQEQGQAEQSNGSQQDEDDGIRPPRPPRPPVTAGA